MEKLGDYSRQVGDRYFERKGKKIAGGLGGEIEG